MNANDFWLWVNKTDGCWEWTRASSNGYGIVALGKYNLVRAHRLSWELVFGEVPQGLFVCHHCDNPLCVRPSHLFLGTNRENMEDAVKKGRTSRGSTRPLAKLTEAQIAEIKLLCMSATQQFVAGIYGVNQSQVSRVVNLKSWKHA